MIKNQNKKNFIWNMIGLSLNSFISLFYLVIVTRINGIDETGIFSFAFTLSLILYNICLHGGRIYQVSDTKNEFTDQQYFSTKIITNAIAFFIALVYVILNKYELNALMLTIVLILIRIVESYSDTIYGVFQKKGRLDYVGKSLFIKNILCLVSFLVVDMLTNNISFAMLISLLLSLVVYIFYDRRVLNKYVILSYIIDLSSTKKVLYVMRYMCLFSFLTLFITNVPRFAVNYMLDESYSGYFSIIIMIPTAILLLGQFIIQPEVLSLSEEYNNNNIKMINQKTKKMLLTIVTLSIICMIGIYFVGPFLFEKIYGINFSKYRLVLVIVVFGGMFNIISTVYSVLLTITRKMRLEFYIYLGIFVLSVIVTPILIHIDNFNGAFISYVLIMFFSAIIFYIFYNRTIKEVNK